MMIDGDFRVPTSAEAALIERMLAVDIPESEALRKQMPGMKVRILDGYGSVKLSVSCGTKVSRRDDPS